MSTTWIVFHLTDHRGTVPGLGTDWYVPTDGRYNLTTIEIVARRSYDRMSKIHPNVTHYRVAKGRLNNLRFTTPLIRLDRRS